MSAAPELSPADLARMGWYGRQRFERRKRAELRIVEPEIIAPNVPKPRRAPKPKRELQPCGTFAAAVRHQRRHEKVCELCLPVLRAVKRRRAAASRERKRLAARRITVRRIEPGLWAISDGTSTARAASAQVCWSMIPRLFGGAA